MNQEVCVVIGAANNTKIIKGDRMTSGRGMVINSGRIIVDLITCFGDSCVLLAAYG